MNLTVDSLCASAQLQLSFSEEYPSLDSSSKSHESTLRSHWNDDELLALVQKRIMNRLPISVQMYAGSVAAIFIQRKVGTVHVRTSMLVASVDCY